MPRRPRATVPPPEPPATRRTVSTVNRNKPNGSPPPPQDEARAPEVAPPPTGLVRSPSRAKYFFAMDPLSLFDATASSSSSTTTRLPALAPLPPLDDDFDVLVPSTPLGPLEVLGDDLLRHILERCPASTLREVKAVDKRTHTIAKSLLRSVRRFPRVLHGGGAAKLRHAAHAMLPVRWSVPASTMAHANGDGPPRVIRATLVRNQHHNTSSRYPVRLRLRPFAAPAMLDAARTTVHRGSSSGWSTVLIDRWVSRDILTIGLEFERLGGAACFGVVGLNFGSRHGGSGGGSLLGEAPPYSSRHAILVDAASGVLHFKGRVSPLALPPARVMCVASGERRPPRLRSGSRVNLIVNMGRRELTVELLKDDGRGGVEVAANLEIDGLPAEVAVAIGLGPSSGESRVRLAGSTLAPADVAEDYGKTMKDLWDQSNVQPLLPSPRGNRKMMAGVDPAVAEQMAIAAEMAEEGAGWGA